MCYGENGMVKFFETLADNVFKHNYSMMEIKTKLNDGKILGYIVTQVYTFMRTVHAIRKSQIFKVIIFIVTNQ